MQRFTVLTSKGPICTTDFESASKILQFEIEEQKRKMSQQRETDWDQEFSTLLNNYIPEDPIKAKYEGGDNQ